MTGQTVSVRSGSSSASASSVAEQEDPPGRLEYGRREFLVVAATAVALTVFMNLPLVFHLTTDIANSPENIGVYARNADQYYMGDPLFSAWEVAWDGHALVHQPLHVFDSNVFWPLRNTLAYSDALLGYGPAGLIGSGPKAALIRYNLLFLFSFALAFGGAYLLGKEVTGSWMAGAIAGAAFAFNPWRVAQLGHLHVLSSGGIPLALWLLWKGWREQRAGMLFAGWVVSAWQLSVGFTLGVPFVYLLTACTIGGAAARIIRKETVSRGVLVAGVAGALLFAGWAFVQAQPYLRVLHAFPAANQRLSETKVLSPPVRGYLAAPKQSFVWGRVTRSFHDRLRWPEEQALFPWAVVVLLAMWGLVRSTAPWKLRAALIALAALFGLLALGFGFFHGAQGYSLLWKYAPGWRASRTPGRLFTFTSLALSMLAALGVADLVRRYFSREDGGSNSTRLSVVGFIALAIMFEAAAPQLHPVVPKPPRGASRAMAPRLHLPWGEGFNFLYMYWSTEDFLPIANGQSTFVPCLPNRISRGVRSFPDERSVRILRALGVNTVVLHTDLTRDTAWAASDRRDIRGLGIQRQRVGQLLIFRLAGHPLPRPTHDPTGCRSF